MSILTKEERDAIRSYTVKYDAEAFSGDVATLVMGALSDALDTVDALEAERDAIKVRLDVTHDIADHAFGTIYALKKELAEAKAERDNFGDLFERTIGYANRLVSEERGKRCETEIDLILLRQQIARVKSITTTNHNAPTIADAHAALRAILAIVEGGESDDSIRRVTCKCINGGETTINWRTGCGETLCHAELIDDE